MNILIVLLYVYSSWHNVSLRMGFATGDIVDAIPISLDWNYNKYGILEESSDKILGESNNNPYILNLRTGLYIYFPVEGNKSGSFSIPFEASGGLGFGSLRFIGTFGISIPVKGFTTKTEVQQQDIYGNEYKIVTKTSNTIFPVKFSAGMAFIPEISKLEGGVFFDMYAITSRFKETKETTIGDSTTTDINSSSDTDSHFVIHGNLAYTVIPTLKIGGELYIGDGTFAIAPFIFYNFKPAMTIELRIGAPLSGTMGLSKEAMGEIVMGNYDGSGIGINLAIHYTY